MHNCCVFNCSSSESNKNIPELPFHEFPSNGTLRKKWIESIPDLKPNSNTSIIDHLRVCSLHFQKDDYEIGMGSRLKIDAIPSIFSLKPEKNCSKISRNVNLKNPNLFVFPTILPKADEKIVSRVLPPKKNYSKTSRSVNNRGKHKLLVNPAILPETNVELFLGVPSQNEPVSNIPTGLVNILNKPMLPNNLFIIPQSYASSTMSFSQIPSSVASFQVVPSFQNYLNKTDIEIQKHMNHIEPESITTGTMNKKDVYSQTEFHRSEAAIELQKNNTKLRCENLHNYRKIQRLNQRIDSLQKELEMYKKKASNRFHAAIDIISKDALDPQKDYANIILDQVQYYRKECPRYSVQTVRKCSSWFFKFPDSYNHVIKENILKLPSRSTLLTFVKVSSKIDLPSDSELIVEEKN